MSYGSQSLYQGNNKSNVLDYSSNKDKSRNTGTTRHRSVSPHVVGGENESFRSGNEKIVGVSKNSMNSGNSMSKKDSVQAATSERQIIDKLLTYIMKEKNISDKEKLLTALMTDEQDIDESFNRSGKKKRDKDSLLMDSVLYNNIHSTSHKEIQDESLIGKFSNEFSKVNMTDDIGKICLLENDKKKQAKDKRFLNKLIDRDRASTSQKKLRPKSSKGIRTNHVKVNTLSNSDANVISAKNKNKKVTNYLNTNGPGNRIAGKQSGRKKVQGLQNVRPSSGSYFKTPKESTSFEKLAGIPQGMIKLDRSKIDPVKYAFNNNSSFMNQNQRSIKGGNIQSRNVTNNLMNAKSLGANLDNFSFIRPQSIKGENNFEKLNRKHKTK